MYTCHSVNTGSKQPVRDMKQILPSEQSISQSADQKWKQLNKWFNLKAPNIDKNLQSSKHV